MNRSDYFGTAFVEGMMRRHAPAKDIRVLRVQPLAVDNSASILAVLTAGRSEKAIGHFGLDVLLESEGKRASRRMVMKLKPHGGEIADMLASLAAACGGSLAGVYPAYKSLTGFANTHRREVDVYGTLPDGMQPEIYGLHADDNAGSYAILMEYLEDVSLLNSVMRPEDWTDAHLKQALRQLAGWHAAHLGKSFAPRPGDAADAPCRGYMTALSPLWEALLDNAARNFPALYPPARVQRMRRVIDTIPAYWQELEGMPRTLVHNDLNPRNTCFKGAGPSLRFCAYDWELATCHVPQYDVVELLCFVLDRERYAQRGAYLEFYRQALHDRTGLYADAQAFRRGFALAARDFGLHRLGLYLMGHSVSPYPFLPRVVESYFDTLAQMDAGL